VRRVQLIRREIREYLPASAVELLLCAAEHVVEGGVEDDAGPQGEIYASLMTTIDLEVAADAFREPADAATAQRLAELMRDHEAVRSKLTGRARSALADLTGADSASLEISLDYEIRAQGNRIFVDADVMGSLRPTRDGEQTC